ncbi:MAG: hypothetical protein ACXWF8_06855 [Methylobacter sp.]
MANNFLEKTWFSSSWTHEEISVTLELINNGDLIDWNYWAGVSNITSEQAARLYWAIDPIKWPDNRYALGVYPEDLQEKIKRLEQWLTSRSIYWSLLDLISFLGEENVPFGMLQAYDHIEKAEPIHRYMEAQQTKVEFNISLEYGVPKLPISDAIGFYQAKKVLGDDWTDGEFALFVMQSEIRIFEKSSHCEYLKPVANIKPWLVELGKAEVFSGELYQIDSILSGFKYSKTDLLSFKSDCRYISFTKACEKIALFVDTIEKAERFLFGCLSRYEITAFHPLVGTVTEEQSLNGERYRLSYFQDWKLNQLIHSEFDGLGPEHISKPQDKSYGDDGVVQIATEQASATKSRKQKGDADKLRTKHFIDVLNQNKSFASKPLKWIDSELRQKEPRLWGANFETFKRWIKTYEAREARKLLDELKLAARVAAEKPEKQETGR